MRGHVTATARIGVGSPHPPDVALALHDEEIVVAPLLERHGDSEPREARTHDHDPRVQLWLRYATSSPYTSVTYTSVTTYAPKMQGMLDAASPSAARMSGERRREQLLDVTAALVARDGFPAVSIRSVARDAGISRPVVYEHFGDLPGLLNALVSREMTRALQQVSESTLAELDQGDPIELMVESLRTYLTAVQGHPDTWRLVLMAPEGAPEILRRAIASGRQAVLERLARAVRPGLRPGNRSLDPELTARTLSAIADEYARLILTDPEQSRLSDCCGMRAGSSASSPPPRRRWAPAEQAEELTAAASNYRSGRAASRVRSRFSISLKRALDAQRRAVGHVVASWYSSWSFHHP